MTSTTFFFIFIPILAIILLAVNLIFAPHNPYQEKDSAFECGFHSFLGQNRTQFSISFFIFALLFLLFDLEILLVYPYVVSAYVNGIYGLVIMLIFFLALTLGFAFELGKNALKIDSRQMVTLYNKNPKSVFSLLSNFNYLLLISKFIVYIKNIFCFKGPKPYTYVDFQLKSFSISFIYGLKHDPFPNNNEYLDEIDDEVESMTRDDLRSRNTDELQAEFRSVHRELGAAQDQLTAVENRLGRDNEEAYELEERVEELSIRWGDYSEEMMARGFSGDLPPSSSSNGEEVTQSNEEHHQSNEEVAQPSGEESQSNNNRGTPGEYIDDLPSDGPSFLDDID